MLRRYLQVSIFLKKKSTLRTIDYYVITIHGYQLQATLNSGYTPNCNNVVIEKYIINTFLDFNHSWYNDKNWPFLSHGIISRMKQFLSDSETERTAAYFHHGQIHDLVCKNLN